ncbi:DeoR/GlpR family DNA-binding transcription regulator [Enterococcus alishanensis]
MIKDERYKEIMQLLRKTGTVKVNDIMDKLDVSDMTVRRDLASLEKQGLLKRVHGGAKVNTFNEELSHKEKRIIHIDEKRAIVKKAIEYIQTGDTIFLGPGTTIELLAQLIDVADVRIVTNCLPVFEILNQKKEHQKIYLVGGEMRNNTQSFFGDLTNKIITDLKFNKAFFSCNALVGQEIMTSTLEEGQTQTLALNNSQGRFLLADSSKIGKTDFCVYYRLDEVTELITNQDETHKYKQLDSSSIILV